MFRSIRSPGAVTVTTSSALCACGARVCPAPAAAGRDRLAPAVPHSSEGREGHLRPLGHCAVLLRAERAPCAPDPAVGSCSRAGAGLGSWCSPVTRTPGAGTFGKGGVLSKPRLPPLSQALGPLMAQQSELSWGWSEIARCSCSLFIPSSESRSRGCHPSTGLGTRTLLSPMAETQPLLQPRFLLLPPVLLL